MSLVSLTKRPLCADRPKWVLALTLMLVVCGAQAKNLYVNNQTGTDRDPGSSESPLRSVRRAVAMVQPGDTIHLLPDGAVYREMISLAGKSDFTIEGHNCAVSGADPLTSDPAKWEKVGDGLHRIQLRRTLEDRHILVVNGKAQMMGRTKYNIRARGNERRDGFEAVKKALISQYPKPAELKKGQFAWEPIDPRAGWLYVKGSLENLEWSVRSQGVQTDGNTSNVTIRNLRARHALNDGFNFHGNAQNYRLDNVAGEGCFDNGISPHGACSFSVEDGQFLGNEMAVGNDFLTETRFVRCTIGQSTQEELMFIGGKHLFEDCVIHAAAPVAVRLVYSKPGPGRWMALKEVAMSGKDPNMKPQYTFRNCVFDSVGGDTHAFIVGPGVDLTLDRCAFKGFRFQVDPGAKVTLVKCTLDGKPLEESRIRK
jgi:hypothetical protein